MLRSVPDNALIGYVQNPQGEVPSYLALSELQRRKDTRAKYQQQQTPESSVAEDLEQETAQQDQGGLAMLAGQPQQDMADQGVAGLDTGDMYQEDSFAGGGIVAFAPGGPVYPNYYGENEEEVTSPLGRLINYLDVSGKVKKSDFGKRREERKKLDEQIQETVPTLIGGKRGFFDQETKAQQREYDQRRRELEAQKEKSPFFAPEPGGAVYDKKDAIDPNMTSYIEQEKQRQKEKQKENVIKDSAKTQPTQTQVAQTQAPQQATESYEDALRKRMGIYKEFMGSNEDRDRLNKKIDAMEKRAARQEELAPWMALTEAGFKTMAGTSPFALTNLGAGAEAGVKSYGAAQDKMAALEEKRYTLMNEAAKADRAEKQAAIKFGEDSYQHKAAMDQKERLGQAELEVRREANRLTKDFNTARIGALTTGKTTKAMADLIQKTNAPIDKKLATLVMAGGKSKEVQDMIKSLQAEKLANENKIRAYFAQDGLAGVQTSATNADPLGLLSQ
jgi:hypothetical protein